MSEPDPKRWSREDTERTKRTVDVASSLVKEVKKVEQDTRPKTQKKLDLSNMSDKEMRKQINRELLERQYNSSSVIASVNRREIQVTTANGVHVVKMSSHSGDQVKIRKVDAKSVVDALTNPLYIRSIKVDAQGRPSQQFIGKSSTVCVNPDDGTVFSLWRTGSKTKEKYEKLKGGV